MMVLPHDHSLSLIDLNPIYPRDEEVYDDEEDLIIKQAFQSSCDRCHQEIIYYHKYYYKCDQCDYSLHKLCGEVPVELQHASHSAHILTLFLDDSSGQCHICRSTFQYKQLRYRCSRCMFNICLGCAMGEAQFLTVYHPSHQHPLIPLCRQRQILAECDACGEEHKGVFYDCSTCFSSLMHSDCVFKPKRLLIQDVTNGCFFHTHPLILSYSFPRAYQKEKFDPTCIVCDNSFYDSENLWIYRCEKCRYYVHFKCTYVRSKPSGSGAAGTSKNYEDDNHSSSKSEILHLPFFDQTQNMFTKLFSRESNASIITHESHQHPLVLVDTMSKVNDLCKGCFRPIIDMPFYKCSTYECDFVLHELCTRLPSTAPDKTCPSRHSLYLNQKAIRPDAFCHVCTHFCEGFFYSCLQCEYNYPVDVSCALLIGKITHKSHPYHPLSKTVKRLHKDYCRMCLSGFVSKEESSFSCEICNFHLHRECALLLPETIKHKYDKHPMTLSYSPIENHEGDYFCEVCEEELNPYISFYHCHECVQSIHSACAQLKLLHKSYTLYGLFENGDYEDAHLTEFHHHPLSFFKGTLSNRGCSVCHLSLTDDFILKCPQCNYAMHADHLNKPDDNMDKTDSLVKYPGHIQHHLRFICYNYKDFRDYHSHSNPEEDNARLAHIRLKTYYRRGPGQCSNCSHPIGYNDYVFFCEDCVILIHAYHIHKSDIKKYGRINKHRP